MNTEEQKETEKTPLEKEISELFNNANILVKEKKYDDAKTYYTKILEFYSY